MAEIKSPDTIMGNKTAPAQGNAKGAYSEKKIGTGQIKSPDNILPKK